MTSWSSPIAEQPTQPTVTTPAPLAEPRADREGLDDTPSPVADKPTVAEGLDAAHEPVADKPSPRVEDVAASPPPIAGQPADDADLDDADEHVAASPPTTNVVMFGVTHPGAQKAPTLSPRLGESLAQSILRAKRRSNGVEKPIPLELTVLADHFGGGLWPGLHVLNSGTGVGKTQLALGQALYAAKRGIPVLYVGLELGQLELDLRALALEAGVPWSALWTGDAGPARLAKVDVVAPTLNAIPFFCELARPMGFSATEITAAVETLRANYPEPDGPGSRPVLVVVDFLQLVGDDPGTESDLRIRIARASYALRDAANRLGVAVLCISSISRERYKLLSDIREAAGLVFDLDENDCPINRRIADPDAIVGAGKESGEIEYSADSVSIIARVAGTWDGAGVDVVFATAKGRATGAMWSPLHFSGFRYEPCSDRGGRIVQAWQDRAEKRARASEQRKQQAEQRRADKLDADARLVAGYVLAHPGCTVRAARANAVANNARRWAPAVERLGRAMVIDPGGSGCEVNADLLQPQHRPEPSP